MQKIGVDISALEYYPNTMQPDEDKGTVYIEHLHKLIYATKKLDVNMVTTFIGRNPKKTVEDNLSEIKEIGEVILKHEEEVGVRITIENCLMLFTKDEWPGDQNIMTSPSNWRKVFEILNSENIVINYDPSHFVW